jgi:hypothetical protein
VHARVSSENLKGRDQLDDLVIGGSNALSKMETELGYQNVEWIHLYLDMAIQCTFRVCERQNMS